MTTKQSHVLHVGDAEVQFYRDHGYFIYQHPLFPQEKFQRLQHFFEDMLAELPEGKRPEAMDVPHFAHRELFEWLFADEVLDFVEAFIGPDILLFRNTLMLKPGNHGSAHRLHQDSPYWHMEPATQITVSIALTDATIDNGCFQVIPGSHKSGLQDWGANFRASNTLTDRDDIDLSSLIQVPLRAGSAIFFDSKLVHGSAANTTPNPRNTALYAYFPPNVRYCPPEGYGSHQKTCPVIRGCGGQSELVFTPE